MAEDVKQQQPRKQRKEVVKPAAVSTQEQPKESVKERTALVVYHH